MLKPPQEWRSRERGRRFVDALVLILVAVLCYQNVIAGLTAGLMAAVSIYAWRYERDHYPVLRISERSISYLPMIDPASGDADRFDGPLRQILDVEIERLEWVGFDNVGVRLRDGRVAMISIMEIPAKDRPDARAAIVAFVSRSTRAA